MNTRSQSGLGIASAVIAFACWAMLVILAVLMMEDIGHGDLLPSNSLVALFLMVSVPSAVVGVALGVFGAGQGNRDVGIAYFGLLANGVFLACLFALYQFSR